MKLKFLFIILLIPFFVFSTKIKKDKDLKLKENEAIILMRVTFPDSCDSFPNNGITIQAGDLKELMKYEKSGFGKVDFYSYDFNRIKDFDEYGKSRLLFAKVKTNDNFILRAYDYGTGDFEQTIMFKIGTISWSVEAQKINYIGHITLSWVKLSSLNIKALVIENNIDKDISEAKADYPIIFNKYPVEKKIAIITEE